MDRRALLNALVFVVRGLITAAESKTSWVLLNNLKDAAIGDRDVPIKDSRAWGNLLRVKGDMLVAEDGGTKFYSDGNRTLVLRRFKKDWAATVMDKPNITTQAELDALIPGAGRFKYPVVDDDLVEIYKRIGTYNTTSFLTNLKNRIKILMDLKILMDIVEDAQNKAQCPAKRAQNQGDDNNHNKDLMSEDEKEGDDGDSGPPSTGKKNSKRRCIKGLANCADGGGVMTNRSAQIGHLLRGKGDQKCSTKDGLEALCKNNSIIDNATVQTGLERASPAQFEAEATRRKLGNAGKIVFNAHQILRAKFAGVSSINKTVTMVDELLVEHDEIKHASRGDVQKEAKELGKEENIGVIKERDPTPEISNSVSWSARDATERFLSNKELRGTFRMSSDAPPNSTGIVGFWEENKAITMFKNAKKNWDKNKASIHPDLPYLIDCSHTDGARTVGIRETEISSLISPLQSDFVNSPSIARTTAIAYCKETKTTLGQIIPDLGDELKKMMEEGVWYTIDKKKFWVPYLCFIVNDMSANWKLAGVPQHTRLWDIELDAEGCFPNAILKLPRVLWLIDNDPHWLLNSISILTTLLTSLTNQKIESIRHSLPPEMPANVAAQKMFVPYKTICRTLRANGLGGLANKISGAVEKAVKGIEMGTVRDGSTLSLDQLDLDAEAQEKVLAAWLTLTQGHGTKDALWSILNMAGREAKHFLYIFDILVLSLNDTALANKVLTEAEESATDVRNNMVKAEADYAALVIKAEAASESIEKYVQSRKNKDWKEDEDVKEVVEFVDLHASLADADDMLNASAILISSINRTNLRTSKKDVIEKTQVEPFVGKLLDVHKKFCILYGDIQKTGPFKDKDECLSVKTHVQDLVKACEGALQYEGNFTK